MEVAPADAARIKFRFRSNAAARPAGKADSGTTEQARLPRIRFGRSSSSSSNSGSDDSQDDKARPRPLGAAAAAAARARAALEAERAQASARSASVYEPVPVGKTTDYSGGVTCVAGC